MELFPLAATALFRRLLKQTLMRVRWKEEPVSTILFKSFIASGTSCARASSLEPTDVSKLCYSTMPELTGGLVYLFLPEVIFCATWFGMGACRLSRLNHLLVAEYLRMVSRKV